MQPSICFNCSDAFTAASVAHTEESNSLRKEHARLAEALSSAISRAQEAESKLHDVQWLSDAV